MASFTIGTYGQQSFTDPATGTTTKAVKVGYGWRVLAAHFGWPVVAPAGGRRSYALVDIPTADRRKSYQIEIPDPDWAAVRETFSRGEQQYQEGLWRVTYSPAHAYAMSETRIVLLFREPARTTYSVNWAQASVSAEYDDLRLYPTPAGLLPPEPSDEVQKRSILDRIVELEAEGKIVTTEKPTVAVAAAIEELVEQQLSPAELHQMALW